MSGYSRKKYPIKKNRYFQKVGKLLPHRICQSLKQLGFKTWMNPKQNKGVDIKVWNNDELVLVGEILNWSPFTGLSDKRRKRIIRNLSAPEYKDCYRVLFYTAMKDETFLDKVKSKDIITFRIGYQLMPKLFYEFFEAKNQVIGRTIDSREIILHLTYTLNSFMKSLNLNASTNSQIDSQIALIQM